MGFFDNACEAVRCWSAASYRTAPGQVQNLVVVGIERCVIKTVSWGMYWTLKDKLLNIFNSVHCYKTMFLWGPKDTYSLSVKKDFVIHIYMTVKTRDAVIQRESSDVN